jgi:hypothetical protein
LEWLGRSSSDRDVVLADWHFGNLLPIYADARVFVGHPIETIGFKEKAALVDRFFDPMAAQADRQALIDRWKITWVVARADQSLALDRASVFQIGTYTLYRVEH